jgi:hypothetical protein
MIHGVVLKWERKEMTTFQSSGFRAQQLSKGRMMAFPALKSEP